MSKSEPIPDFISQISNDFGIDFWKTRTICKSGHIRERGKRCKECWNEYFRGYRKREADRVREINKRSYAKRRAEGYRPPIERKGDSDAGSIS